MNTSDYQQEFDKIIARKYFDKTLEKTRKEAFSKFLNLGMPTKKWENWRHTNLSLINKQNFRISEKHDAPNKELNISDYYIENCYLFYSLLKVHQVSKHLRSFLLIDLI